MVNAFRAELSAALRPSGVDVRLWTGTSHPSNHLLHLETHPGRLILYVKGSSTGRSFWGLTRNQVSRLRDSGDSWFVVLLQRSKTRGFILTSSEVNSRIVDDTFELAGDGDYKVKPGDLVFAQRFDSLEALLGRLSIPAA